MSCLELHTFILEKPHNSLPNSTPPLFTVVLLKIPDQPVRNEVIHNTPVYGYSNYVDRSLPILSLLGF